MISYNVEALLVSNWKLAILVKSTRNANIRLGYLWKTQSLEKHEVQGRNAHVLSFYMQKSSYWRKIKLILIKWMYWDKHIPLDLYSLCAWVITSPSLGKPSHISCLELYSRCTHEIISQLSAHSKHINQGEITEEEWQINSTCPCLQSGERGFAS